MTAMIESLFRYNYRPLCMYALHYLEDLDLSEDIVQDSFAALWEKLAAGTEIRNKRAYLYTMVRNRCLDRLKSGKKTESLDSSLEEILPDEEESARDSITEAQLWTAIDRLPPKRRQLLLMSKRDGLKYSEIADRLGLSVNTVRNQISRALESLKNGAAKVYCWFCSLLYA